MHQHALIGINDESLASESSVLNPVSLYADEIDCEKLITDISTKDLNCYILRFATAFGVSKEQDLIY